MDNHPELTDGGFTLRRYCQADAEPIYQAVRESISEISPWMPWCHTGYSLNDSKTWTASCDETWAKGKEYNFVIISNNDGQPLGVCGLNHIDNENRIANVGYWVRTARTRQGVATSAALLLARFGFNSLKLNRLEIVVATDNRPSQRVAEKVGAKLEGILRKRLIVRKKVYDAYMYSLIREDIT
jgi:RimJ/RimL family protein N-acetyltransferase